MNVDQIKRNLRNKNINVESNTINNEVVQKPKEESMKENNIIKFKQPFEEEDEEKPQSKVWEESEYPLNTQGNIKKFISKTELENPVYDWRCHTKKGKLSRKNFTDYLISEL